MVHQSERELSWLLERYRALQPRRVLEIGSLAGGTLWHWMAHTAPGAEFAVIDLPVPWHLSGAQQTAGHDGGWQRWAEQFGHTLTIIPRNSHDAATRALVAGPFDYLFIDADHHYAAAKQDYELYAPLVRPGGLIALHDIDIAEDSEHYGVKPLWLELKAGGLDTEEYVETLGWWGIGVIHVS